jgi:hypothetical protein
MPLKVQMLVKKILLQPGEELLLLQNKNKFLKFK